MASASVVAELGDKLVPAAPGGPCQCLSSVGKLAQRDPDQQSPDFRDGEGDQFRIPFFDSRELDRERITDNVA